MLAGLRSIETLDVDNPDELLMSIQAGDLVSVLPVLEELDDAVTLVGHTTRPGSYEWTAGMRLTDLVTSERMLKPKTDLGYVLIRREQGPDRQVSVLSADLGAALTNPASAANVPLQVRDRVIIFELGVVRTAAIALRSSMSWKRRPRKATRFRWSRFRARCARPVPIRSRRV